MIIVFSAALVYTRSVHHEQQQSQHRLAQLIETVSKTASIAAFVKDQTLAKEVISGLVGNDFVSAARLHADSTILFSQGQFEQFEQTPLIKYQLLSPFDSSHIVGELVVQSNQALIKASSQKQAFNFVMLTSINSILLILIILFLLNKHFINTIKNIASHLHLITPGSEQRVNIHPTHDQDELGMLTNDINQLLSSVETQFNQERKLRDDIASLEQRFRNIFEQTSGGLALIDQLGHVQIHNPAFEKILGPAIIARLIAKPQESMFSVFNITNEATASTFYKTLSPESPLSIDVQINQYNVDKWIHCSISVISLAQGQHQYEVIIHDISERRLREETFKLHAELDSLTGVYNRRGGILKARELFDAVKGSDTQYAVLMIDLDNFKPVNDQFGHEAGDIVLRQLTERLQSGVRTDDIVIRWGGDEFLVVIRQSQQGIEASRVANKLLNIIKEPINIIDKQIVSIGASIGIAIYPHHGTNLDTLSQHADEAMYMVKSDSKNDFAFYSNDQSKPSS
jgi:diguanylate cyclase (GGDEF)-like protein/PAS domain S-box-containing protein